MCRGLRRVIITEPGGGGWGGNGVTENSGMLLKPESSNPLINGKERISAQRHVEGKWVGTRRSIAFFLILPKSGSACLDAFITN